MDTFPLGGIAKSLLALLAQLEGKYQVDVLLMRKEGLFVPLIPCTVNLISDLLPVEFRSPQPQGIFRNFVKMSFRDWRKWVVYSLTCSFARLTGGLHGMVNVMDVWIAKHTPSIHKHYDVAIAYQGGRCIYYIAEQIDADIKIGYVHSNYSVNETDFMLKPSDSKYFPKMNNIVTISQVCLESLWSEFPALKDHCLVIENICSPKMIATLAEQGPSYDDDFKGVRIVSMGRFDIHIKGMDLAIEACQELKYKGLKFRWYWLGEGEQRFILEDMIKTAGVQDVFILLGAKINPYPYIKDADIYVQPSRIEGKSVALDEVKALYRPIVVTEFGSVYDQFTDEQNALIAKMEPKAIANKIERLIKELDTRKRLIATLQNEKVGNEEQALVLESIFN